MAQILAASPSCQMRLAKPSSIASSKLWNSVVLKQKKQSSSKVRSFKVMALQSDNSTINRVESLLNLDTKPFTDRIIAEYIWIGGSGIDLRSKSRTLEKPVEDPSELPKWNYDGSSTGQAPGEDSEVILYPQAIFRDPFRGGNNILVICDTYTPAGEPIPTNKRARAAEIFSNKKVNEEIPWFGIEQEYTLLQPNVNWPLGWPVGAYPGPQGPYYCGVGAEKSWGRDISDAHYKACLYAGINISEKMESTLNTTARIGSWSSVISPPLQVCESIKWKLPTATRRVVLATDRQNSNFRWRKITTGRANVAAEAAARVPTSVPVRVARELAQAGYKYLDVRTPDEFSIGHPSSAINVPYMYRVGSGMVKNPSFLRQVSSHFRKHDEIIIGCESGERSLMASTELLTAGFTGVTDIAGGYVAWTENELPVEE